jgi:PAS domain S-box-containing protein
MEPAMGAVPQPVAGPRGTGVIRCRPRATTEPRSPIFTEDILKQESLADAVGAALLQSRSDAIIVADLRGAIGLWNPGAERLFGHPAADALGQSLDFIIPERLRARHWEGFDHWVATGEGRHKAGDILAVPALHRDGHTLKLQFTLTPLAGNDGTTTALIAILHERTQPPTPSRGTNHPALPAASR